MRLLIFDFDGVIADSLDEVMGFYNENCGRYGLPFMGTKEEFVQLWNINFFSAIRKLKTSLWKLRRFVSDLRHVFSKKYSTIRFFPGMKRVMNVLQKGNRVVIVTSNFTKAIELCLAHNKLEIKEIFGADLEKSKVRKIKRARKKHPGLETYYIGDTLGDMKEGRKAGAKTVGVTWGYHPKKLLKTAKPDFLVDSPEELLALFED